MITTFKKTATAFLLGAILHGCASNQLEPDAYGNFEGTEVTISSEANGKILDLPVRTGDVIESDAYIGQIDTVQLFLQKKVVQSTLNALRAKLMNVDTEVAVLFEQRDNLSRELKRAERLLAAEAITQKQVDDLKGQFEVVAKQINATRSRLSTGNRAILAQVEPMEWQLRQMDDQISRARIKSPQTGTVLAKFVESGEIVNIGRPLLKLADLNRVFLRAYMSETQLAQVNLGQKVNVTIDFGPEGQKQYDGKITWISQVTEFTPKIIQTREERVNLVYAFRVEVENDGAIKLGMPGEVWFTESSTE